MYGTRVESGCKEIWGKGGYTANGKGETREKECVKLGTNAQTLLKSARKARISIRSTWQVEIYRGEQVRGGRYFSLGTGAHQIEAFEKARISRKHRAQEKCERFPIPRRELRNIGVGQVHPPAHRGR